MREKKQQPKRKPGRPKRNPSEPFEVTVPPEMVIIDLNHRVASHERTILAQATRIENLEAVVGRLNASLTATTGERNDAQHLLAIIRATVGGSGA